LRVLRVAGDVVQQLLVGGEAVQAVGTEEEPIPRLEGQLAGIDFELLFHARDGARDDVAERVALGVAFGDQPVANLLGHPRVIARQLLDPAVADEIRAAVADVGNDGLVAVDERAGHRRAHAAQLLVFADPHGQLAVGHRHRRLHAVRVEGDLGIKAVGPGLVAIVGRVPDELVDRFADDLGGEVSPRVPAHAVDDEEQPELVIRDRKVLVAGALPTGIRVYAGLDTHGARWTDRVGVNYTVGASHPRPLRAVPPAGALERIV